jgi:hypothetical protein
MISRMNGVDNVTIFVRLKDTSVFLIGIFKIDYKVADL